MGEMLRYSIVRRRVCVEKFELERTDRTNCASEDNRGTFADALRLRLKTELAGAFSPFGHDCVTAGLPLVRRKT